MYQSNRNQPDDVLHHTVSACVGQVEKQRADLTRELDDLTDRLEEAGGVTASQVKLKSNCSTIQGAVYFIELSGPESRDSLVAFLFGRDHFAASPDLSCYIFLLLLNYTSCYLVSKHLKKTGSCMFYHIFSMDCLSTCNTFMTQQWAPAHR